MVSETEKILRSDSVEMGSVDLQEVDEILILLHQDFDVVLGVLAVGGKSSFGGLTWGSLSGEILHKLEDLSSVLLNDISREACDAGVLHSGIVPSANVLAVSLKKLNGDRVEAHQGLCCSGDDR